MTLEELAALHAIKVANRTLELLEAEALKPRLTGPQGDRGDVGAAGADGKNGTDGERGATGCTGSDGTNGQHGVDGKRGPDGPRGESGERGAPGLDGARGVDGQRGERGPKGDKGEPGLVWRGPYSAGTPYAVGDAVSHEGSSWVARFATSAAPSVGNVWHLLAQKGADGSGGGGAGGASTADAVSVEPAGNLASTDVQAALEELQGDIDVLDLYAAADVGTATDMTLYVETTGDDSAAGSLAAPVLTPNGALAKIPGKKVRHLVQIKVGAGNFPGFNVEGFTIDPLVPGTPCGISILGTFVAATLATGTATGTITATAAGSTATPSFAVVTDSTQAWTVNALKGFLARAVVGGATFPITENTATTFTVCSASTFGAVSGAYEILDWGTVVTTPTTTPPALAVAQGAAGTAANAGVVIRNNAGFSSYSNGNSAVRLEGVKVALSVTSTAFIISSSAICARCCGDQPAGTNATALNASGSESIVFSQGVLKAAANSLTVSTGGSHQITMNNTLVTNSAAGGGGVILNSTGGLIAQQSQIDSHATGVNTGSSTGRVILTGSKIAATTTGIFLAGGTLSAAGCALEASGLEITGATTALSAGGPNRALITTLKLNTCTNGVVAVQGALVKIGSASTFTTVTNELTLDGTISTLAVMRAQTPKLLTSSYGTAVYE